MKVAVLGASPNPERFSNKAIRALLSNGHEVVPVNPAHAEIENLPTVKNLRGVEDAIDTLTVYVSPKHMDADLMDDIVALHPSRVVLNPGTESEPLMQRLKKENIPFVTDCTLVMLQQSRF